MVSQTACKDNLEAILDFLKAYRGWNQEDLGRALNRDPGHIIPEKRFPALDLVVAAADELDWSVADLVHLLVEADGIDEESAGEAADPQELDRLATEAHRAGEPERMIELARQQFAIARTPDERARACLREQGGWDRLGRYQRAIEAARNAAEQQPDSPILRRLIEVNLANGYYMLWHLTEAVHMADGVLRSFETDPPSHPVERMSQAFAHYVRGNALRRMIAQRRPDDASGERAEASLRAGLRAFRALDRELPGQGYGGIARTCLGGLIEVMVKNQRLCPSRCVERLLASLDVITDVSNEARDDMLESHGWWCIIGCNVALRHLDGEEGLRAMAIFTNKASEIAERTGNWALHERVFTMDYARRQLLQESFSVREDWVMDRNDLSVLAGTMGRFPKFRDVGMRIFKASRIIAE